MEIHEIENLVEKYEEVIFNEMDFIYDKFPNFDDEFYSLHEDFVSHRCNFDFEENGDSDFSDEFKNYINLGKRLVEITKEIEMFDPNGVLYELKEIAKIKYINFDEEYDFENYSEEAEEDGIIDSMFPNQGDRIDDDSYDDGFDLDKHFGLD